MAKALAVRVRFPAWSASVRSCHLSIRSPRSSTAREYRDLFPGDVEPWRYPNRSLPPYGALGTLMGRSCGLSAIKRVVAGSSPDFGCGLRPLQARLGKATPHWSFLSIRLLEAIDVNFLHLHHRLHDVFRLRRIFIVHKVQKNRGGDLPGNAEFVSQPTAGDFLAAG